MPQISFVPHKNDTDICDVYTVQDLFLYNKVHLEDLRLDIQTHKCVTTYHNLLHEYGFFSPNILLPFQVLLAETCRKHVQMANLIKNPYPQVFDNTDILHRHLQFFFQRTVLCYPQILYPDAVANMSPVS